MWHTADGGPLLLVAGGSGFVPLMAMLRHRAARSSTLDTRLLLSTRSRDDVLFRDELAMFAAGDDGLVVHQTFTREAPAGWSGFARRVDAEMLTHVGPAPSQRPRIFAAGRPHSSSVPPTCSWRWATTRLRSAPSDSARQEDEMIEDARWLDGNALSGLLQEVFGAELTGAPHTCPACGAESPVAAHRLYLGAGAVLRCPACGQIALVAVALRDRDIVHLTGTWRIDMPRS